MLKHFTIKNYKSFKDETTIYVDATSYRLLSSTNIYNNVLKGSVFFGANSSGKTNLLKALKLLFDLLFSNQPLDLASEQCVFSPHNSLYLEYEFKFDDDIIHYAVSYDTDTNKISQKILCNEVCVFHEIVKNAAARSHIRDYVMNRVFEQKNILAKFFDYISNSVYINANNKEISSVNNLFLNIHDYLDQFGTEKINHFFNELNFNQQLIYSDNEIFLQKEGLPRPMPFSMESVGMQNLMNMLPSLFHIIDHNGMLIIDEFSNGFHNELGEVIIRYFMNKAKASQIFLVSHSTNLLSNTLLRPDQLYAIDFHGADGSMARRFSDEKPREAQNIEQMYISGVFGGIPRYGEDEYKY